jgi:uncharacterized LabA/DUF88 family protein
MAAKSVGVFIDIVNQYFTISQIHKGAKLNYQKYLTHALDISDGELHRAFAYGIQIDREANGFIACLRSFGYEPRYKKAPIVGGKSDIRASSWAMGIAVDIFRILDRIDVLVLGSSNTEFIPLIQFAKEKGVKTIIFACDIPSEIREIADQWIEISDEILEIRKYEESE